jgi:hypothetical protein
MIEPLKFIHPELDSHEELSKLKRKVNEIIEKLNLVDDLFERAKEREDGNPNG